MLDRSEAQVFALIIAALAVVAGLYLLWVSRRRQSYSTTFVAPASVAEVWRASDIRPGHEAGVPNLSSCKWVDESQTDMSLVYANGLELRQRVVAHEVERFSRAEARFRFAPDAPWGDLLISSLWLAPTEGGTEVKVLFEIEREQGGAGVAIRAGYPWLPRATRRFLLARLAPPSSPWASANGVSSAPPADAGWTSGLLWKVVVVLATLASLAWLMGPWAGLGCLAMLVCHEYGHVWSMRRHGHATARFYLVPFLGGFAIGDRKFTSEAESVEISLMGPAFGLAASLAPFGVWLMTGDPFFAALSGFLALVNGFNLAPTPPLDGGWVAKSLLRVFGPQIWFAGSGLLVLAGALFALYFKLKGLLILSILGALGWSGARTPDPDTRPLSPAEWGVSLLAYLALAAAHFALFVHCFEIAGIETLSAGPSFVSGVGSE